MFKNRSFQVKMVKDTEPIQQTTFKFPTLPFKTIDKIVKDYAKGAAIGGVLIYAAIKTIDTASIVVVNNTNPANR